MITARHYSALGDTCQGTEAVGASSSVISATPSKQKRGAPCPPFLSGFFWTTATGFLLTEGGVLNASNSFNSMIEQEVIQRRKETKSRTLEVRKCYNRNGAIREWDSDP